MNSILSNSIVRRTASPIRAAGGVPRSRLLKPSLLLWLALGLLGCGREVPKASTAPALPSVSAQLAAVEVQTLTATEEVVGTVRARLRSAVEAKIPGRIETLRVVPGQSVKAGELLLTLDAREVQARLDSALAVREQTARDLQRISQLVRDGAVTQADLDATQARHRVALASVTEAETVLAYTQVTAPFDGVIIRKLADVGDLASPGRSLLEIEDPRTLRFEADVPEALLERIVFGAKLPVSIASVTNRLVGEDGEPVRSPFEYVNHASQTDDIRQAMPTLAEYDLEPEDVAFAWTYTTQTASRDLRLSLIHI